MDKIQLNNALAIKAAKAIGVHLKRTRQLRKISVSDVATKLNLTKSMIDNLEAGVWDSVKGQNDLTSYADFLGLSSENLWAKFEQDSQKKEALSREEAKIAAKEKGEARRAAKLEAKEKVAAKKVEKAEAKEKAAVKRIAKAEMKKKAAAEKAAKAEARKKATAKKTTRAETKAEEKLAEKTDKTANESVREGTATLSWLKPVLLVLTMLVVWFGYQQWQGKTESESLKQEIIAAISEIESIKVEPLENNKVVIPKSSEPIIEKPIEEKNITTEAPKNTAPIITPEPVVDNQKSTLDTPNLTAKETLVSETVKIKQPMESKLVLAFGGGCLANVKDAAGKTLMNNVKQLGDYAILVGKPPIKITLANTNKGNCWVNMEDTTDATEKTTKPPVRAFVGDAKGVVVTFDGTVFNTQPFVNRDGTSRFGNKE